MLRHRHDLRRLTTLTALGSISPNRRRSLRCGSTWGRLSVSAAVEGGTLSAPVLVCVMPSARFRCACPCGARSMTSSEAKPRIFVVVVFAANVRRALQIDSLSPLRSIYSFRWSRPA